LREKTTLRVGLLISEGEGFMPYCMYCGQELPEDIKFCSNCGKKVVLVNVCPRCGTKMKKEIYTRASHPFAFNALGHAL